MAPPDVHTSTAMPAGAIATGTRLSAALGLALLAVACGRTLPPAPVVYDGSAGARRPAPVKPVVRPDPVRRSVIARKGDTLYTISRRYAVPLRALIDINRLPAPYTVALGRRLMLPAPRHHLVSKGETIYGIARKYRVRMSAMVRLNRIRSPYRIAVGQRLRLPVAAPPRTASRSTRAAPPAVRPAASPPPVKARKRVRTVGAPPPRAGRKFRWPVRGRIIVAFGPRGGGLHNDGINISARTGTAVRAAENGVVAYAGNELQGFGNLLLIKHAGGWMTAYAHVGKLLVSRGQRVQRGETIARVGRTGDVSRPQLHFEIRRGDRPVNPVRFLGPGLTRV